MMDSEVKVKNNKPKSQTLLIVGLFISLIYLIGALYFRTHFFPKTYIGDISVAYMSVDPAFEKVNSQLDVSKIDFYEKEKELGYLDAKTLGIEYTDKEKLEETVKEQSIWFWPIKVFSKKDVIYSTNSFNIDEDGVKELIDILVPDNLDRKPSVNAGLIEDEETGEVTITDEEYGNQVSSDLLKDNILINVLKTQPLVKLEDSYARPEWTKNDDIRVKRQEKLEKMAEIPVVLELEGEKIQIPQEEVASWLTFDEMGQPTPSLEAVQESLNTVNIEHAAINQSYLFKSSYQGEVWVNPGTFGWYIDIITEAERIQESLVKLEAVDHEPVILGDGYKEEDPVGGNYVEVDLDNQMMLIYKDYQVVLETPIVSGAVGTETVPGMYQVWNMESPSVLKGYNPRYDTNYETPVQYWIAFDDDAQGIHDASWQGAFGGTEYVYNGSLGCINVSSYVMPEAYELIDIGTPVIVFRQY